MTPEQIADCRAELFEFTRAMFRARKGADMRYNWHQKAICDKQQLQDSSSADGSQETQEVTTNPA